MALSQLSMLRAQVRTGSIPLRWRVRTAATELGAVDAELGSAPVIIVGAGAAGLGCATRLARAGGLSQDGRCLGADDAGARGRTA